MIRCACCLRCVIADGGCVQAGNSEGKPLILTLKARYCLILNAIFMLDKLQAGKKRRSERRGHGQKKRGCDRFLESAQVVSEEERRRWPAPQSIGNQPATLNAKLPRAACPKTPELLPKTKPVLCGTRIPVYVLSEFLKMLSAEALLEKHADDCSPSTIACQELRKKSSLPSLR